VNDPVQQYQQAIDEVRSNVEKSFSGVFPDLAVQIRVRMDTFVVDAAKELAASSGVRFVQGDSETGIRQQGTGSRRALFWTLLQVRNLMMRERKLKLDRDKQETDKLRAVTEITAKIETRCQKMKLLCLVTFCLSTSPKTLYTHSRFVRRASIFIHLPATPIGR
jgi:hypothetical protein